GLERALAQAEEFDVFGFAVPPAGDALGESGKAYALWFEAKALRRLRRFEARRRKLKSPGDWTSVPKSALKALLRKGVPPEHRGEVWWSVLGCQQQHVPGAYQQYLDQVLNPKTCEEIERDLLRTFPNHRKFRCAAGRGELRNVLRAFANHSPRILYCQGLNFITGLLLVVFQSEERAFWALVCAVERLGVEGYYSEGMTLLRADMQVLGTFLERKCPKVAQEFKKHQVELLSICSEWYITWFAKSLPFYSVLRVWDTLFFEGFKVLFRVAMGVFKRAETEVLQCGSFDSVMQRAKQWPRCMVEHNELLKASFVSLPLKRRELLLARDEALCRVEQEDEEHKRRLRRAASERSDKSAASALSSLPPPTRTNTTPTATRPSAKTSL
ncbi:unnamed protein product, partial [Polarella glacialis]